ncbi:hypothetical protein ALC56_11422 [Trachymyrmex septentrionalis]|uniref:Protein Spindly n=2 Tax=Trachymyrmex septentrionalis TaxID=34720 RepID=A0A195F169_9HYME|nr:PREDICTED: protein Spindly-like [Trachymyrmex septentrionalis]KYN34315.1 hypothetical protein ALC56_11422 [Trachymyrmex septentrionalis]
MSELYGESVNNTKIEEHLEKSMISQDDYKKMKQENEDYRQELYVLRLKLETSDAIVRDLQDSGETLENNFKEYVRQATVLSSEKKEKYKAEQKEYENHIANLETNQIKNKLEIKELQKELKKYKDIINNQPFNAMADNLTAYKEELRETHMLLQNEKERFLQKEKNEKTLVDELAHKEVQCEELRLDLHKITKDLVEKNKELENARESARELAAKLEELESSNIIPASDICKGNSLFAEVEDRRQMLLDKMKTLSTKYNEAKQALDSKTCEIKLLRAEKIAISRKWETDIIDTLQENADLLVKYKSRIFDLENKLKAEMRKNDEIEETQSANDDFNYAQSLLAAKKKELKELNEKIEKQTMQMLVQDEVNNNISRQLRYWQSKAKFLETQNKVIKDQLEMQDKCDNKILLESIKNCTFPDNANFEKTCSDSLPPHELMPKSILESELAKQGNSTEVIEKPAVNFANEQKECRRFVGFTSDTKNSENKPLKKHEKTKKRNYPIIVHTIDNDNLN